MDTKVQIGPRGGGASPPKPFTLRREKGCAFGPVLLKETTKTRKKP
jgi:hypothetical protein